MIQRQDKLFNQVDTRRGFLIVPDPEAAYAYHAGFCERLRRTIEEYPLKDLQISSASYLKQSLLLRYSNALVEDYSRLMQLLQVTYARCKEGLTDPRRATLTAACLEEITRDACFYDEVNESAAELAGAVDASVDLLKLAPMDTDDFHKFQVLAARIKSSCTDFTRIIGALSTTLEKHLRLFELSRAMHEAQSVRLLSILASLFLPLSLATGLLSMQTRFSDLHYLLYDFFGVLVLLGTIVVAILAVLRLHAGWKVLSARLDRSAAFKWRVRPKARVLLLLLLLLGWALLLSSFLVGMIKDVGLGLKILGYGAVAAGGSVLIVVLCPLLLAAAVWAVFTGRAKSDDES